MEINNLLNKLDQKDQYRLYKLLELKFKDVANLDEQYGLTVASFIEQNPNISNKLKGALMPYQNYYVLEINEKFRGIGKEILKELDAIRYKYS